VNVNAEVWTTLARLLDAVLDLPPEERARWLDELPAEHEAMKPRLRQLLLHARSLEQSDFLDNLPVLEGEKDVPAESPAASGHAGEVVGATPPT
jgi:hypothetical protein